MCFDSRHAYLRNRLRFLPDGNGYYLGFAFCDIDFGRFLFWWEKINANLCRKGA
jgi:hypothetical protein